MKVEQAAIDAEVIPLVMMLVKQPLCNYIITFLHSSDNVVSGLVFTSGRFLMCIFGTVDGLGH
jgi:hypothetical protein